MSSIAEANHVSLPALEAANPQITNPSLIYAHELVHIPVGGTITPAADPAQAAAPATVVSPSTNQTGATPPATSGNNNPPTTTPPPGSEVVNVGLTSGNFAITSDSAVDAEIAKYKGIETSDKASEVSENATISGENASISEENTAIQDKENDLAAAQRGLANNQSLSHAGLDNSTTSDSTYRSEINSDKAAITQDKADRTNDYAALNTATTDLNTTKASYNAASTNVNVLEEGKSEFDTIFNPKSK
jgi:hypothetical protein